MLLMSHTNYIPLSQPSTADLPENELFTKAQGKRIAKTSILDYVYDLAPAECVLQLNETAQLLKGGIVRLAMWI